ncbi:MAG: hypothetical protein COU09_00280 [Candidatus Harrisonbacteria bacterium CG10_big_fil_rev_8_21_14_0_10_44_23]|uniref:Uncharacterized protein n=1 Tax=Candidatus Harrisonbacteria bacterium CG10_big_fil_rev_8_21_14_0_10_44_23 TaxID=1974585 RepID=A0A2H0UQT0_9BACT|nr:MAG: hypothetical protein COU09_00280 [Candidatus Harrisonbacteria bacterium CG10_big_fil_rev_8_21_14_0_10_44_23]
MNKSYTIFLTIALLAIIALGFYIFSIDTSNNEEVPQDKEALIRVFEPIQNAVISSPLIITGEARGNWYFEASFPVRVEDANGNVLGQHYATAQGEWMTEDFVPFKTELSFDSSQTQTGVLILEKDNPSGLSENADELRIPIRFNSASSSERTVKLYYYNSSQDEDENGNIMCSKQGLVAVERDIPVTQTPIQDTVRLLLKGEITEAETAQGITTEYPLIGFEPEGASLANGILTLGFSDPNNSSSGGSCRAGILWFQIEETAKQFDGVYEVYFQPEELFQP